MKHCIQLNFYTTRSRRHDGEDITSLVMRTARDIGIPGVTVINAASGYGHDGKVHSEHFFELADEPLQIITVSDETAADKLLQTLSERGVSLFYTRSEMAYGTLP